MSATGTIDAIEYKQSKAGKAYAKVSINSEAYLVFGKTLDSLRRASEGSSVEFSSKPSDNGDGQILTFLKVNGGGQPSTAAAAPRQQTNLGQRPQGGSRGNDQHIQLSIFYGYAKDLVVGKVLTAPIGNPTAVADLVSTVARELMRKFHADSGADAPKAPEAVSMPTMTTEAPPF